MSRIFTGLLLLSVLSAVHLESHSEEQNSNAKQESVESGDCGCKTSRQSQNIGADNVEAVDHKMVAVENEGGSGSHNKNIDVGSLPRTNQMVYIPGGTFTMGTNEPVFVADGEIPARQVTLDSFYMDKHEVSNAEFERFVKDKNYKTEVRPYL